MPRTKPFEFSPKIIALTRKQQIKAMRTTARQELRAIKKAGGTFDDLQAIEALVTSKDWLLSHNDQKDLRKALREKAKVTDEFGHVTTYQAMFETKQNIRLMNQSIDVWNALHKDEINAGTLKKRGHIKSPITKKYTQKEFEEYIERARTDYAVPSVYFENLRTTYITNTMRAFDKATENLNNKGKLTAFVQDMLNKHVRQHGDKRADINYVYEKWHVLQTVDYLADLFGFTQEWLDFQAENSDYINNL